MSIYGIFNLLGGLALLIYGMKLMSSGLEQSAGHKLKKILEKLTSSPLRGLFLGLLVTMVIQSSAAVIVMLVGFVNSGAMTLTQTISVTIGSNIGTTVTAWILSLTSLQGDAWYITILKPSTFAPLLVFIGMMFLMFAKRSSVKQGGNIAFGFGILMVGMTMMSDSVKPLANSPTFTGLLTLFSNPFLGVLAGLVIALILQSSSASMGVVQALSATGTITWGIALPLIIGQNVGSCGVSLISCLGANKNAKRTAFVHLYYNLSGTVLFFLFYFSYRYLFGSAFFGETVNAFDIAYSHTVYNVILSAIFIPGRKLLAKLAMWTWPESKDEKEQYELLDERLLATPAIAVDKAEELVNVMGEIAIDMVRQATSILMEFDEKILKNIKKQEKELDAYEDKLGTFLVHLSAVSLKPEDNYRVSNLLYFIGDFERIGDHALNISYSALEMYDKKIYFSDEAKSEVDVLSKALVEVLSITSNALKRSNLNIALNVEPLEEVIDDMTKLARNRHIKRMQKGVCSIEMGFVLSDLLTNFERIADHCSNIASAMVESSANSMLRHAYLKDLKSNSSDFRQKYQDFSQTYALPKAE